MFAKFIKLFLLLSLVKFRNAWVVKLVNTLVLGTSAFELGGSSPLSGTSSWKIRVSGFFIATCTLREDLKKAKNIFLCSFVFEKNLSGGVVCCSCCSFVFATQLRRPSPLDTSSWKIRVSGFFIATCTLREDLKRMKYLLLEIFALLFLKNFRAKARVMRSHPKSICKIYKINTKEILLFYWHVLQLLSFCVCNSTKATKPSGYK